MAKYKIYVNPNNQTAAQPQQTQQLVQQMAQNAANQQIQQQAQQQQQQADPTRQKLNELIMSKLMPVEIPQEVTIQDIIKAGNTPKGYELLNDYLGGPQNAKHGGGNYYWDANKKSMVKASDIVADERRRLLENRQAQSLTQLKEQNDLANSINNAFMQQDIADLNDKRARDLAEQEMQFKREEMEARRQERALDRQSALQRALLIHGGGGGSSSGGSVTGGAAGIGGTNLSNIKMTAADRKSLTENKTTLANIESGLKALEENPDAYTFMKGILGADITNRIDPKGVKTRTQIDNITAVYRKWLTGAQMSDQERKAYERFLPAPTDNYNIVKAKLEGMRGAIERSNNALLSNYGVSETANNDPLGLGL